MTKFNPTYNADSENQSNVLNLNRIPCTTNEASNQIVAVEPALSGVDASTKNAVNATVKSIGIKFKNNADGTMYNAGTAK